MKGHSNPHSVSERLPGVYQYETFVHNLCAGLDDGLAPVVLTLDSFPAYLDPGTTPADMLSWLAGWIGVTLESGQAVDGQRRLVRQAVELLRWRGTAEGLREAIRTQVGVDPQIAETGGSEWSATPGTPLPGEPGNRVVVRLAVPDPGRIDVDRIENLVASWVPAHVAYRVEIVAAGSAAST